MRMHSASASCQLLPFGCVSSNCDIILAGASERHRYSEAIAPRAEFCDPGLRVTTLAFAICALCAMVLLFLMRAGPQLLVPMEIASFLLLATASVVLLCTLLRCCCRYVCAPTQNDDASETSGAAELEEVHDDEEALVSAHPRGRTRPFPPD